VRDKDAIASVVMIAEMTAYVKSQGKTLYEYLVEMYMKFGFYREDLVSITKKGKSGSEEIKAMMTRFREDPPKKLAGTKVVEVRDYQKSTILNMESGVKTKLNFSSSNVLQFFLEDGSKISARPSGTEPKIKFYVSVKGKLHSKESFEEDFEELGDIIKAYMDDLDL
jgi:phosphoglucomutase